MQCTYMCLSIPRIVFNLNQYSSISECQGCRMAYCLVCLHLLQPQQRVMTSDNLEFVPSIVMEECAYEPDSGQALQFSGTVILLRLFDCCIGTVGDLFLPFLHLGKDGS